MLRTPLIACPRRRPGDRAEDLEAGGLARSGRAHDRDELAVVDAKIDRVQDLDRRVTEAVRLRDALELEEGNAARHGNASRNGVGPNEYPLALAEAVTHHGLEPVAVDLSDRDQPEGAVAAVLGHANTGTARASMDPGTVFPAILLSRAQQRDPDPRLMRTTLRCS